MRSRKSFCEALERRQLLAGDVCLADEPIERIAGSEQGSVQLREIELIEAVVDPWDQLPRFHLPRIGPTILRPPYLDVEFGRDLLEEDAGIVAAVRPNLTTNRTDDSQFRSTLFLFQRLEDGGLDEVASIELEFTPHAVILTDQMVMVLGQGPPARDTEYFRADTKLLSISRDDLTQRSTISLPGVMSRYAESDGRLFISTAQPELIEPYILDVAFTPRSHLPLPHNVTVFDISGTAPERIAEAKLPDAVTENMIIGDDIVMIESYLVALNSVGDDSSENSEFDRDELFFLPSSDPSLETRNRLVRYRIEGETIESVATLDLAARFNLQTEIASDGQTAVVIGQQDYAFPALVGGPQAGYDISLIDLSEDQPKLFESLHITTREHGGIAEIGEKALLISDTPNVLIVVNTDQSIDIDAENRIRRIEIPGETSRFFPAPLTISEVSDEMFVISRRTYSSSRATNDGTPSSGPIGLTPVFEMLTVSLDEFDVVSQSGFKSNAVALFTPSSQSPLLIGIPSISQSLTNFTLSIGSIDEAGNVSERSTIDLSGAIEIDADADRLLVRHLDHLTEYRWDDIENPIVTPLGEPLPAPTAVDDVYSRNSESNDRYLRVLENDQTTEYFSLPPVQIVELIDAPPGVTIATSGNALQLTGEAIGSEGTFEFQYVIRQGSQTSSATVTLTLFRYDGEAVRQAVNTIVSQAAADLNVDVSEIRVGGEQLFTRNVMSARPADGVENPLGGQYGVIVQLLAGDHIYQYAANFEGDVARLSERQYEPLIDLRMRVVDAEGNPIESIQTGDEFFIEVIAGDLRELGDGVFAVAFDLPLPANKLELTGEMIMLGLFDDLGNVLAGDGTSLPSGIDEFNALEVLVKHPGNAPQPVVRFGVRAIGGGPVTLQLDPAESKGAELLIRGINDVILPLEVQFGSLTFNIDGTQPTDTDRNGSVTPLDALRVINFLGRHGSVHVDDLEAIALRGEGESSTVRLATMRRLDTNADGRISALDALTVINDVARVTRSSRNEAEPVDAVLQVDFLDDDETI